MMLRDIDDDGQGDDDQNVNDEGDDESVGQEFGFDIDNGAGDIKNIIDVIDVDEDDDNKDEGDDVDGNDLSGSDQLLSDEKLD